MKKFLTLVAVAGMACTVAVAQPSEWGALKLVGNQLCSDAGKPVQLRGFSTFSIHYEEGTSCLSDMHFQAMKAWNCNAVRIAMYVDEIGGGYIQRTSNQKSDAKKYVKMAVDNDMYAVMDWHILEVSGRNSKGNPGNPKTYQTEAEQFFDEFSKWVVDTKAADGKSLQGRVLYELCNEPSMGNSFAGVIKPYCQSVMDKILANDNQAICILGTEGWCQKVLEATKIGVDAKYKNHAMFSFHYYACSHEYLCGDFSQATSNAPVIVSEWSTVSFSGDGNTCVSSSNRLMGLCDPSNNNGEQLVSWFFWNWGRKDEGSTVFTRDCSNPSNQSTLSVAGRYIVEFLNGGKIPDVPKPKGYGTTNVIMADPTDDLASVFDWANYDTGGEGVAYHDGDGAAYDKDNDKGYYKSYTTGGDEVDCFSNARNRETENGPLGMNSNFTYGKGNNEAPTSWNDKDALCVKMDWGSGTCSDNLYKSLNAGLGYCMDIDFFGAEDLIVAGEPFGEVSHGRAFGGVDISKCSGRTKSEKFNIAPYGTANICSVEPGEWISYTVNVEKAGYYKVHYLYSGQTKGTGKLGISLNGKEGGNIIRDLADKSALDKSEVVTKLGSESLGAEDYENWEWSTLSFLNSRAGKDAVVVFRNAGKQSITITFVDENGNTGPLMFELVDEDISEEINAQEALTAAQNSEVVVYPNPTSGDFTVALGTTEAANVQVVNMAGQVVYSTATNGEAEVVVNKALASGIYTVVVSTETGVRTTKLQVK